MRQVDQETMDAQASTRPLRVDACPARPRPETQRASGLSTPTRALTEDTAVGDTTAPSSPGRLWTPEAVHLALEYVGGRLSVPATGLLLGRAAPPPGCIRDRKLSRRHCLIEQADTGLMICTDLRSKNGTLHNGHRLTAPAVLRPGDLLTVGDTVITVVRTDGSGETG